MQFFSLSKNVLSGLFQIHSTVQPIPTNGVGSIAVVLYLYKMKLCGVLFCFCLKKQLLEAGGYEGIIAFMTEKVSF